MLDGEYVMAARKWTQDGLRRAWTLIGTGKMLDGWDPGKAFEHIILRQFEIEGATVVWPFPVVEHGQIIEQIDGVVCADGMPYLIEAKDWAKHVPHESVAKLASALGRRPPTTMGLIYARTGFTDAAKSLAQRSGPLRILMWEFEDIDAAIRVNGMLPLLRRKLKMAVEKAMPDFMASGGALR